MISVLLHNPAPPLSGATTALIDRLVHHCHMVTIRGNSYLMRQHTDLWHALHTSQDPEPATTRRRRAADRRVRKSLNTKGIELNARIVGGVCDNTSVTARKLLILNGEMSEWSIEHAWKAKRASDIQTHRSALTYTRSAT